MSTAEVCSKTVTELTELVRGRELSPVEVIEAHLARIDHVDGTLNAFVTVTAEQALADAREAEARMARGEPPRLLEGAPYGLKDSFHTKGVRTTSGSRIFGDHVPESDSTIGSRMKESGAILLGKLNMAQLAFDATGANPDYGDVQNPWNPAHTAGGSSSGSAAAVAGGECAVAFGTDTGGSVRLPAALCGVVGLKPTYGLLSRFGITAMSWSLDHPGPITRTVEDCALVMNAVAGHDPADESTAPLEVPDYTSDLAEDVAGLTVGVPREFFEEVIDPEVERSVLSAIATLEALGASVGDVHWPEFRHGRAVSEAILAPEAATRFRDLLQSQGSLLDPSIRSRIERGFFVTAVEYLEAQRMRKKMIHSAAELFEKVDVVVGPTAPIAACEQGVEAVEVREHKVSVFDAYLLYGIIFNVTGLPALTVPCGLTSSGLPIGLQIGGGHFDEPTVLRAGYALQQALAWGWAADGGTAPALPWMTSRRPSDRQPTLSGEVTAKHSTGWPGA